MIKVLAKILLLFSNYSSKMYDVKMFSEITFFPFVSSGGTLINIKRNENISFLSRNFSKVE